MKIFIDTNVLFHPDKRYVVDLNFTEIWEKCKKFHSLKLMIPKIVIDELIFQHYQSTLKRFKKGTDLLSEVSIISKVDISIDVSLDDLKNGIRSRLYQWADWSDAEILPVPFKSINWEQIAEASVWRLPPFELIEDKNRGKSNPEKGFRDALILETVCDYLGDGKKEDFRFITEDKLLANAVIKRIKGSENKIYQNIDQLLSELKMLNQSISMNIIKEAADLFLGTEEKSFFKDVVMSEIYSDSDFYLPTFNKEKRNQKNIGDFKGVYNLNWPENVWHNDVGPTIFCDTNGKNYQWATKITFQRVDFQGNYQIYNWNVDWKCTHHGGKLTNPELLGITPLDPELISEWIEDGSMSDDTL